MPSSSPGPEVGHDDPSRHKAGKRAGRLVPPAGCLLIVALLVAAIVALQAFSPRLDAAPRFDAATANVLSLILGFIGVVFLGLWFAFLSGYGLVTRLTVGALAAGLVALSVASLKVEQVSGNLVPRLTLRWLPKADRRLGRPQVDQGQVDLRTTTEHDYPQFLGPRRNLTVTGVRLARDWRARPPKKLWKHPIGAGWSAFSAVNGFAVTMEQRGEDEMVTCYELLTGKMRWFHAIRARHETVLGGVGPRSTPTIDHGKVYALGATGILRCLDGADGSLLWSRNLLKEYGVGSPQEDLKEIAWGRAASPLIVDGLVVVPAGGPQDGDRVSLVAYDQDTGRWVWEGGQDQISYSSPNIAVVDGQRQIVIVNESSVSGHAIGPEPGDRGLKAGEVLWRHDWPGDSSGSASTSQAVPLPGGRVFLSKGYGGGAALLQLVRRQNGKFLARQLWRNRSVLKTKLTNVVIHQGYVYGLSDGILECVALQTGRRQWKRGRYGHGQILLVGQVILVQAESGEVAMVAATPKGHVRLGSFQAIQGKSWNNLCLYGRYLLVRNAEQAACYELPVVDNPRGESSANDGAGQK